jgi:imidazoleglycerol-phosphate dehydratase
MRLGFDIKVNKNEIKLQRTTKETRVVISLNQIKNKKLNVNTTIPFLDHMIETLAWRANLNIGVQIISEIKLAHTISEDIGITLGRAILELYKSKIPDGIEGFGFAQGVIDEAFADAAISIEGRANYFIEGPSFENVDGTNGYNLTSFLEGFSQGCKCTLRINYSGRDPHHSWESAFRALGLAIRKALEPNSWRNGTISGTKGSLE